MYIYDTVLGVMLPWHKYEIFYLFCLPFSFTVGPNSDRKIIFAYAALKSSWEARTYELTSRYYDVGCVQVSLVGTRWRFNFST